MTRSMDCKEFTRFSFIYNINISKHFLFVAIERTCFWELLESRSFNIPNKIRTVLEDTKSNTLTVLKQLSNGDISSLNEILARKGESKISQSEQKMLFNLRQDIKSTGQDFYDELKKRIAEKSGSSRKVQKIGELNLPALRIKLLTNLQKYAFRFNKPEDIREPYVEVIGNRLIAKCYCPECDTEMICQATIKSRGVKFNLSNTKKHYNRHFKHLTPGKSDDIKFIQKDLNYDVEQFELEEYLDDDTVEYEQVEKKVKTSHDDPLVTYAIQEDVCFDETVEEGEMDISEHLQDIDAKLDARIKNIASSSRSNSPQFSTSYEPTQQIQNQKVHKVESPPVRVTLDDNSDADFLFCRSISMMMKNLPLQVKNNLKLKILYITSQKEIECAEQGK